MNRVEIVNERNLTDPQRGKYVGQDKTNEC